MEVIIMIKELVSLGKFAKKSGVFAGGVLFGSLGLKLLASKEAKHVYAKAVATSYKLKDGIDATVSTVKQHADDVLEEAKDLYAEEKNAQLVVETSEK
ncbi:hypothetical protein HMPREF0444_1756 [Granulicatella adiacens ATCC 49175]|uniref:DUF1490 domain-containing protein n=2 Tax=Carnobacteriaceae TaxID=186828 RepID=C8NIL1_9LACT|nr:hypothetical protein HMPREF0444_1756 [Granulicatella adiacens ATCC 49175]